MASQVNSTIVSKVYKARQTMLTQLELRGFNTSNYNNFSINDVNIMLQNKQGDMLLENEKNHKVYVKFCLNINKSSQIRIKYIYEIIEDLFNFIEDPLNKDTDQVIFVTKSDPNDSLIDKIKQIYNKEGIFITIYSLARLQFNILEHSLIPPHTILSEEEKHALIKKWNIVNESQFPEISRFDPISLAIGIRPGQLCKIIRKSKTAITSNYYRKCY